MKTQPCRSNLLILVAVVGAMIQASCTQDSSGKDTDSSPVKKSQLPKLDDIKSINAVVMIGPLTPNSKEPPLRADFKVPEKSWKSVFAALTPAEPDPNPSKWVGLGKLLVKMKKGETIEISLYATRQKSGAFAIKWENASVLPWWKRSTHQQGNSGRIQTRTVKVMVACMNVMHPASDLRQLP